VIVIIFNIQLGFDHAAPDGGFYPNDQSAPGTPGAPANAQLTGVYNLPIYTNTNSHIYTYTERMYIPKSYI
jgi:hypothetical protein